MAIDDPGTGFRGSDGVLYRTTPADLKQKAGDIRTTQATVQGELERLKSYVVGLEAVWGGIAATTFQELMREWDMHAARLQQALLAIAGGLDGTADNYVSTEQANVTNVSKVQLPPARLG
ncbi:WXG100 family type VII secretion target [Streptomyces sp. NPDC086010]|jgi:WXG100 family type VII secretion target|uniref:WXG100 family type VII secretion target n=1 Tax=Streptomyces sp. NPDC086010 TaxID=3365745 RepID=UPI0037D9079B